MRITNHHALALAIAAFFVGAVAGQETTSSQSFLETGLKAGDVRASNLLGAMVKRLTGDSVGEVKDLIVSGDADIRLAVISVGGVLGVGGKTIAIPFTQLKVAPDGATVYLSLSEEELGAWPAFDLENVSSDVQSAVHDSTAPPGQTIPEANVVASVTDDSTQENAVPAELLSAQQAQAAQLGEAERDRAVSKSKAANQPASALIGAQVVDPQDSAIGKVTDVVVTAEPPEVQVIVELSENLGRGSRLVAVPLPELTIRQDAADETNRQIESVETSLTVAQLDALPQYQDQNRF